MAPPAVLTPAAKTVTLRRWILRIAPRTPKMVANIFLLTHQHCIMAIELLKVLKDGSRLRYGSLFILCALENRSISEREYPFLTSSRGMTQRGKRIKQNHHHHWHSFASKRSRNIHLIVHITFELSCRVCYHLALRSCPHTGRLVQMLLSMTGLVGIFLFVRARLLPQGRCCLGL